MTTEEIVARIIDRYEGDIFTEDPVDTGGATKYGITLRTLRYYRRRVAGDPSLDVTVADVRALGRGEAIDCGVTVFASETYLDLISDWRLRYAGLDYAFHSGWVPAIRSLQRACGGLVVDGVFGPKSQQAVAQHRIPTLLGLKIATARAELMQDLIRRKPTQKKFAFGWWVRVTDVQRVLSGE